MDPNSYKRHTTSVEAKYSLNEEEEEPPQSEVSRLLSRQVSDSSDNANPLTKIIDSGGFGPFQAKVFWLCGAGNFIDASEVALLSVMLPLLKEEWKLNLLMLAVVGCSNYAGMLMGSLFLGILSDSIGRKFLFEFTLVFSSVAGLLCAISPNIYVFVIFRFFLGIGYGGNVCIDYTYLSELLPTKRRGLYLAFMDIFFALGAISIVSCSWIIIPLVGWRWMTVISVVPAFSMVYFRRGFLESPRYLILKGREHDKQAAQVLIDIARYNFEHNPGIRKDGINYDYKFLRNFSERVKNLDTDAIRASQRQSKSSFGALFAPSIIRTTLILPLIWCFNALGGVIFLWIPLYMASELMKGTIVMTNAYQSSLLMSVGVLAGSILGIFLVEFAGRLLLMRISLFLMPLFLFILSFLHSPISIEIALPFFVCIRNLVVQMLYIYTPEVFPTKVRSSGLGLSLAFHRLSPTLGQFLVHPLLEISFGHVCYFFACCYIVAALLSLFLPIETKGRALDENLFTPNITNATLYVKNDNSAAVLC